MPSEAERRSIESRKAVEPETTPMERLSSSLSLPSSAKAPVRLAARLTVMASVLEIGNELQIRAKLAPTVPVTTKAIVPWRDRPAINSMVPRRLPMMDAAWSATERIVRVVMNVIG